MKGAGSGCTRGVNGALRRTKKKKTNEDETQEALARKESGEESGGETPDEGKKRVITRRIRMPTQRNSQLATRSWNKRRQSGETAPTDETAKVGIGSGWAKRNGRTREGSPRHLESSTKENDAESGAKDGRNQSKTRNRRKELIAGDAKARKRSAEKGYAVRKELGQKEGSRN